VGLLNHDAPQALTILLWALVFGVCSGRGSAEPGTRFNFTNVTTESGIRFVHSFGDEKLSCIVEDTGSGNAMFDFDGDGLLDIYLVSGRTMPGISGEPGEVIEESKVSAGSGGRLYRNNGGGTFADVTDQVGLPNTGFGMGCCTGDFDSDGFTDLYVTCYDSNHLYRNQGDGTFLDVTKDAGTGLESRFSTGCSFLDYDRDGDLDLFVANYLNYDPSYRLFYPADSYPGPLAYTAQHDSLLRNEGGGVFTDVSAAAKIEFVVPGRSMSCSIGDVNDDGWIDIYVANDLTANYLYINRGDGTFREEAEFLQCAFGVGGEGTNAMAVEFEDFDRDGDLDVYVTDGGFGSLYRNDKLPRTRFTDVTVQSNTATSSAQYIGWGAGTYDFDNDGFEDIFRVNGDLNHPQPQEDLLFAGQSGFTFDDVSSNAGSYFKTKTQGRGAAFGDMDLDGDIDAIIMVLNGPAALLENRTRSRGNWIRVELVGTRLRDPIGTAIRIRADGKTWTAQVRGGSSYLSQSERIVHVGLGSISRVDQIEILWPMAERQVLESPVLNRQIRMIEPLAEGQQW